jgi:hypothetical protein
MEILDKLPPVVALVLALLLVVWLVLALLVPFMIESIRGSTRKTHLELADLNEKLDRVLAVLEKSAAARTEQPPAEEAQPKLAPAETPRRDTRPPPTRKEPTISV